MKKAAILLLGLILLVSVLAACGDSDQTTDTDTQDTSAETESTETEDQEDADQTEETEETGFVNERTEELVIKIGSVGSGGENDSLSYPAQHIMDTITEATEGMITFEYYPNSQLGNESALLDQILTGTLDMAPISANVLATVWPEFYMFSMPFAFPTLDAFWEMAHSDGFYDLIDGVVSENGEAKLISLFAADFRGCQNTERVIDSVDDFQGLKFRVMSGEIYSDIYNALGASTATIAFSELYTALQQGVVNGEDVGIAYFYDFKFYEVESYLTKLNMVTSVNPMIMATDTWNKLSEAEQQLFLEVAIEADEIQHEVMAGFLTQYDDDLEALGVTITQYEDLTDEAVEGFREAVEPMWEKYKDIVGEDFYNSFREFREPIL